MTHEMNPEEVYKILKKFELEYRVDVKRFPEFFKEENGYAPGDEKAPFFSERLLYVLFGKEDARTILALVDNLARCAGVDVSCMF
jgi:hypothetical protein